MFVSNDSFKSDSLHVVFKCDVNHDLLIEYVESILHNSHEFYDQTYKKYLRNFITFTTETTFYVVSDEKFELLSDVQEIMTTLERISAILQIEVVYKFVDNVLCDEISLAHRDNKYIVTLNMNYIEQVNTAMLDAELFVNA